MASNVEFYEKQKNLQNALHDSEKEQMRLEQQLNAYLKSNERLSKLKAAKLQGHWKRLCENEVKSRERKAKLLQDFDKIERHMNFLHEKTERLRLLNTRHYEEIMQKHPDLRTYTEKIHYGGQRATEMDKLESSSSQMLSTGLPADISDRVDESSPHVRPRPSVPQSDGIDIQIDAPSQVQHEDTSRKPPSNHVPRSEELTSKNAMSIPTFSDDSSDDDSLEPLPGQRNVVADSSSTIISSVGVHAEYSSISGSQTRVSSSNLHLNYPPSNVTNPSVVQQTSTERVENTSVNNDEGDERENAAEIEGSRPIADVAMKGRNLSDAELNVVLDDANHVGENLGDIRESDADHQPAPVQPTSTGEVVPPHGSMYESVDDDDSEDSDDEDERVDSKPVINLGSWDRDAASGGEDVSDLKEISLRSDQSGPFSLPSHSLTDTPAYRKMLGLKSDVGVVDDDTDDDLEQELHATLPETSSKTIQTTNETTVSSHEDAPDIDFDFYE